MTDVHDDAVQTLPEEWSEGLNSGKLLIQTCGDCGKPNMYPRYRCPFCQSNNLTFTEAAGIGTLHSYTVVRAVPPRGFEDELPFALGVVKLSEGVQLTARLAPNADGEWSSYKCDAPVKFVPSGDPSGRAVALFELQEQ